MKDTDQQVVEQAELDEPTEVDEADDAMMYRSIRTNVDMQPVF